MAASFFWDGGFFLFFDANGCLSGEKSRRGIWAIPADISSADTPEVRSLAGESPQQGHGGSLEDHRIANHLRELVIGCNLQAILCRRHHFIP